MDELYEGGAGFSEHEKVIFDHLIERYEFKDDFLRKEKKGKEKKRIPTRFQIEYYILPDEVKELYDVLKKKDTNILYLLKDGRKKLPEPLSIKDEDGIPLELNDKEWFIKLIYHTIERVKDLDELEKYNKVNRQDELEGFRNAIKQIPQWLLDLEEDASKYGKVKKVPPKKSSSSEKVQSDPPKKSSSSEKVQPPKKSSSSEKSNGPAPEIPQYISDQESSSISEHEQSDNLDFCKLDIPKKRIMHFVDFDKNIDYIFVRGLPKKIMLNIVNDEKIFKSITDDKIYDDCKIIYYQCTNKKNPTRKELKDFFENEIQKIQDKLNCERYIIINDFINPDDTNKIIFNKIVKFLTEQKRDLKQLISSKEIFAWYLNDKIVHPIGFNYENNIITNDDVLFGYFLSNDCKNSDIIDPNFVDDEGRKILDNVINESYNNLFGMNDLKDNVIFFRTLQTFLEITDCNPHKTHSSTKDIQDIDIRKWLFGVINKYWPKIENTLYITDFLNPELAKERNKSKQNNKYISIYNHNNLHIDNNFTENVLNDINIHCNRFIIDLLEIKHNNISKDNYIDIVKLFCNFTLEDKKKSGLHYCKLTVKNENETYYKFYKPKLRYTSNLNEGILDLKTCNKFIKGHYIQNKYGLPDYLYSSDTFVMKIYIKSLSCEEDKKYITLVINRDGRVQCIVDSNISKLDLKSVIHECNKKIKYINKHKIYSEKNMNIDELDENFLHNNKDTVIGKFNCQMYIPLVKDDKLIEFDNKKFLDLLENFYSFVRIEKELKQKTDVITIIYKKVNNYENLNTIDTVIAKMSNPEIKPPYSQESIIEELMNIFNISYSDAEKNYNNWKEINDIKIRDGERIKEEVEPGINIRINQNGSNIQFTLKNICDFDSFHRVTIFLQSLTDIYKNIYTDKINKKLLQNIKVDKIDEIQDMESDELSSDKRSTIDDVLQSQPPRDDDEEEEVEDDDEEEEADDEDEKEVPDPDEPSPEFPDKKDDDEEEEGDDDDDDDELTDDSEPEEFYGGGKKNTDNPKGYLLRKLRDMDPGTYSRKDVKPLYDKSCSNGKSDFKMPVILTKDELKRIHNSEDKNSGYKSYTDKIRASDINVVNKDPNLYYICPKYFDIRTRLSLDPEKVEDENGKLKPEFVSDYILRRDNINYFKDKEFKNYSTDVLRPNTLGLTPVCCGKKGNFDFSKKNKIFKSDEDVKNIKQQDDKANTFYISDKTPADIGQKAFMHPKLDELFSQNRKELNKTKGGFFKFGVKQNNSEKNETPSIINACYETLELYHAYYNRIEGGADLLYDDIKNFIMGTWETKKFIVMNDYSLYYYLIMGNSQISLLFKRNENDITDKDIIDFFDFSKHYPKQLEILDINIDPKLFHIKTINEYNKTEKKNEVNFALQLFLSRKYYFEYLNSNEFKDDKYIIPLLDIFNQHIRYYIKKEKGKDVEEDKEYHKKYQFIVLEDKDDEIYIKHQFCFDRDDYKNTALIYKKDDIYEPILFFDEKDDKLGIYADSKKYPTEISYFFNEEYQLKKNSEINDFRDGLFKTKILKKSNFGKVDNFFINSYNQISYMITDKKYILPYKKSYELIKKFNFIYDLSPIINHKDYPTFNSYIKSFNEIYYKNLKDAIMNDRLYPYLSDYYVNGLSVIEDGDKSFIVNIILKNETYIPVKPVEYVGDYKDEFRKLYDYDLFEIDNSIQNNRYNYVDPDFIEAQKNINDYLSEKETTDSLFKKWYFDIFERYDDKKIFHIDDNVGIKEGNRYKFIILDNDTNTIKKINTVEDSFLDYDYNVIVKEINDNEINLEINLIDEIKYILNKCTINEHKRNDLYSFLKDIFKIKKDNKERRILYKFIDALIINKDDVKNIYSIVDTFVDIYSIKNCIKQDELFFSRTDHINGYLEDFFYKTSRFIFNENIPTEIKPIVSVLRIIPDYIKNFFNSAELHYPEQDKNDINFLAYCLKEENITALQIEEKLIENYKSKIEIDNPEQYAKNINRIRKYIDNFDPETHIEKIKESEYKLTSIDLNLLNMSFNVGIIYINDNNNKYSYEFYENQSNKYIILYNHYDELRNSKLGCIKLNDKYINTLETIRELDKSKKI